MSAKGNKGGGEQGRHQPDHGASLEYPRRGSAEHRALAQELEDIEVRLQERWTDTSGKGGFGFADDPDKEQGHGQQQGSVDGEVDLVQDVLYRQKNSTSNVRRM
jgi:hypothetical protein